MMNEFDSFSVCFNVMKIKYATYDQSLDELNFLQPTDKVNVFINLESILRLLSNIKDVDRKVYSCTDFNENIISNIVNLAAHYRKFFRGNNLDTRVYLYMTGQPHHRRLLCSRCNYPRHKVLSEHLSRHCS